MTPEALVIESMFMVDNKEGEDVPFLLNSTQRRIDNDLTGRDLIPKARQEGVSTYFLARYTAACMSKRNVKAVIISHEGDSTQRLLKRCNYFINNIRGPAPVVGRDSINVITFPKTNGMIYIGTAGSRKFGRGDTISHLHCSEYAYWPNPKSLLSGLLQAVPMSGEIAIESTGNGVGNDYHRRVLRAYEGVSQWHCHFFNWIDFDEYKVNLTDEESLRVMSVLSKEWEEDLLARDYGLTAEQIVWRRIKLEEMDYDLRAFKQEYPTTLDECFQAAGDSIFGKIRYVGTKDWKDQGNHLWTLEGHPNPRFTYVIGGDPSGGVGRDNAAAEVFCLDTMQQVGEYAHNRIEPDVFGEKVVDIAKIFNNAYIVIESNNHGPVTLDAIRRTNYDEILLYDMMRASGDYEDRTLMKLGLRTTARTKPIMIGKLRTALALDFTIHSPSLRDELSTFVEHENGKMAAQDGCKDDRVMASACAVMGIERAGLYATPDADRERIRGAYKDPFLLDNIIDEMQGRRGRSPISPQHGSGGEGMPHISPQHKGAFKI